MDVLFSRRAALWFPLLLAAALAAVTYWLDHIVRSETFEEDGANLHEPDFIIEHFRATQLETDGRPSYRVTAKKMIRYADESGSRLEDLVLERVAPDQTPIIVRARIGVISGDREHVFFTGNVEALQGKEGSPDRMTVQSSFLHVMPKRDFARTDKTVRITRRGLTLTAVGMELDSARKTLKLLSRVTADYAKTR